MDPDALRVDPNRVHYDGMTNIFVRALSPDEHWMNADIAQLSGQSLLTWLRSRGGANEWAEATVFALLDHGGHPTETNSRRTDTATG